MKVSLIVILVSILFEPTFGQSKKLVIIETIDKGDYFYIPNTALEDSVNAILFQDKTFLNVNPENRPIEIYWNSNCNDGSYILTITPEQIFFSSGHNSPNPNFLYWVININQHQFQLVNTGLRKETPKNFKHLTAPRTDSLFQDESAYIYYDEQYNSPCLVPKEWTESSEHKFESCCKTSINTQMSRYFEILNSLIPNDSDKLRLPDIKYNLSKSPKYFSYTEQDIYDWAPSNFFKPIDQFEEKHR